MNYNGNLLPHLPGGGSHNGSPDMRLAASNLSLGSNMGGKNKGWSFFFKTTHYELNRGKKLICLKG